jgi:hypothetical protein
LQLNSPEAAKKKAVEVEEATQTAGRQRRWRSGEETVGDRKAFRGSIVTFGDR